MPKGIPLHVLSEVDERECQALCVVCGRIDIRKKKTGKNGRGFNWECGEKRREEKRKQRRKRAEETGLRLPNLELIDTRGGIWQPVIITQTEKITFGRVS